MEDQVVNNIMFNYVMNVVTGILMIIISTGIGYIITLVRGLMATNTTFKIDINTLMQEIKSLKDKIDKMDKNGELHKEEINELKMKYLELKIKLEQLNQKLQL